MDSGGAQHERDAVRAATPRQEGLPLASSESDSGPAAKATVLHGSHVALGARMVGFGGYDMPVQYPDGILKEHAWTREHAGLFDVSHMGPSILALAARSGDGEADNAAIAELIEPLICGDIRGLARGQLRYTLLLNEEGGILDDLIVGRPAEPERQGELFIVVNAGTKEADFGRIAAAAGAGAELRRLDDRGLIALQGPQAAAVLDGLIPDASALGFMRFARMELDGAPLLVSRSGYTGEDGFEVLVPGEAAERLWSRLLGDERVRPAGLGARDSLRLEAGLPLYGHDLDETTSPIEADLGFAVSRRRREARDFPGAERILRELEDGPARRRVGLLVEGAPARQGAEVLDSRGDPLGGITSGGFSPTLKRPIAMAYVDPARAPLGAAVQVMVRGRAQCAAVTPLPFVPHRYARKA